MAINSVLHRYLCYNKDFRWKSNNIACSEAELFHMSLSSYFRPSTDVRLNLFEHSQVVSTSAANNNGADHGADHGADQTAQADLHFCCKHNTTRPRGNKTFFMLNSAELEIYPAHKC